MKPSKTLSPPQWMRVPETTKVMDALNTSEKPGECEALFVGGCVRNMLLGEPSGDIDIATKHLPETAQTLCQKAGIRTIPTGIDHGTITAIIDDKKFEITSLRKDVETDGRRAVVAYTDDWKEDAMRRDFTINTLLADRTGNIYDPTGQGLSDIEKRRVVFVGEPSQRIAEDTLRILRFFRFHGYYGAGGPDENALKACRNAADKISSLSKERITQEMFKILSHERCVSIVSLMFENKVLVNLLDKAYDPEFLKNLCHFQKNFGLQSIAPRLFALAGLSSGGVLSLQDILLIPKVFIKDIAAIEKILTLPDLKNDHAVKVAVYKHGRTSTAQALMVELAQDRINNKDASSALDIVQNWDIPNTPVNGNDLIKAGYTPGPDLGKKLLELEEAWIGGGF